MKALPSLAVVLLLVGCAPGTPDAGNADAGTANDTTAVAAAPVREKSPEEAFADTTAAAYAYHAAAGRLAQSNGGTTGIKALGKTMEADNGAATALLKFRAKDIAGGLFVDPTLSADQQAGLKALEVATGPAFDAEFKRRLVPSLDALASTLDAYRQSGGEMALQSYAYEALPKVRGQATRVRAL